MLQIFLLLRCFQHSPTIIHAEYYRHGLIDGHRHRHRHRDLLQAALFPSIVSCSSATLLHVVYC
uniref:Uncharacterized protein n=1 Tax=Oryza brachyantha TaxID=4533 RepID=J3L898_ORYBR